MPSPCQPKARMTNEEKTARCKHILLGLSRELCNSISKPPYKERECNRQQHCQI